MDQENVECNPEKSERHPHKMSEIRRLFDDIESLDQIYLKRRLVWFEKVSIMKQPDQGTVDYLENS